MYNDRIRTYASVSLLFRAIVPSEPLLFNNLDKHYTYHHYRRWASVYRQM